MAMDPMMGEGGGGPGSMAAAPPAPSDEANEAPSVFLSAENLGGKKVKAGDTLTLTVRDVDPETGDVQADLAGGGSTTTEAAGGYAEDFDNAVPEET